MHGQSDSSILAIVLLPPVGLGHGEFFVTLWFLQPDQFLVR